MNYAAASNGAKIVSANPESKATAVNALKENRDSYYLSPCATSGTDPASGRPRNKWITVELSETVSVTAVTIANYEFHASAPRAFEVWGTAGPADVEEGYFLIMRAVANEAREPQTFEVSLDGKGHALWSKHVRFAFASHYGAFHFCTLSLLRVHGKDATQTLKEEMEAIDAEAREVEEILRENDEANEILREKERAEAERRGGGEEAEAEGKEQAAAARARRDGSRRRRRRRRGGWDRDPGIPGIPGRRPSRRRASPRRARRRCSCARVRLRGCPSGRNKKRRVERRRGRRARVVGAGGGAFAVGNGTGGFPTLGTLGLRTRRRGVRREGERRTNEGGRRTNEGGRTTEGGCSFFGLGQRLKRLGRADDDAGRTRG